jgi:hypothetical protein
VKGRSGLPPIRRVAVRCPNGCFIERQWPGVARSTRPMREIAAALGAGSFSLAVARLDDGGQRPHSRSGSVIGAPTRSPSAPSKLQKVQGLKPTGERLFAARAENRTSTQALEAGVAPSCIEAHGQMQDEAVRPAGIEPARATTRPETKNRGGSIARAMRIGCLPC